MSRPNLVHPDQPLPVRLVLDPNQTVAALTLAIVIVAGMLGCRAGDEIQHYQAAKITSATDSGGVDSTAATQRMLAAIALHEKMAWFFKMVGPQDAVGEQADGFRALIQSLEFVDGQPQWSLPSGWSEKPGTGIRFATLVAKAGDADWEVSVTSLPNPADGDDRAYNLANINRWRGQLQLRPLSADALQDESEQIDFQGGTAILVDIAGKPNGDGGMSRPPFAGVKADSRGDPRLPAASPTLKFERPDGWEEGELVVSRGVITLKHEAAFTASDGDRQVEITVDRMPSVGDTLANVNRWRRQVGLAPQDDAAFRDSVEQIDLAGKKRDYVQLIGDEETILGVIAEHNGQAWFIKLKGDNELAAAQREGFEAFVTSMRFE